MRILLVASRPPDRQGAGDAKMAQWSWDVLAGAGHSIALVQVQRPPARQRLLGVLRASLTGRPLQIGLTFSAETQREVHQRWMDGGIDLLIAVHARAAAHVPAPARRRALAFIIDAYGQNYRTYAGALPFPQEAVYRMERGRMDRYERSLVQEFARVGVVNDDDARHLQGALPGAGVVRLSLPVDVEFFSQTRRRPDDKAPCFGFVGRLNYVPNRDAVTHLVSAIWPELKARWPTARLRVVGARPNSSLRRFLASHGVEMAADVSDVRVPMEEMTALLAPMRLGGGIQVKTLEAMAAGVPVVCSSFARRGISAVSGEHILLAESPQDYVAQAARLIDELAFSERIAEAARTWVMAHHGPSIFAQELLDTCAAIASGRYD